MKAAELDKKCRFSFGESETWDKDGIQIDCGNDIKKAVVALDCTTETIAFAIKQGASALVCHHPLIYEPLKQVSVYDSVGKRVSLCIKSGVSVLAYHTCLDITEGGVNDRLCEVLGIQNTFSFLPFGRCGFIKKEIPLADFVRVCEKALETKAQNVFDAGRPVKKIAVISGGGKDYVPDAVMTGADTYLTGEVNHAAITDCGEYGINLICATHFATENVVLPFLAEKVKEHVPEVIAYGL